MEGEELGQCSVWGEKNLDKAVCGGRRTWTKQGVGGEELGQRSVWGEKNLDKAVCGGEELGQSSVWRENLDKAV